MRSRFEVGSRRCASRPLRALLLIGLVAMLLGSGCASRKKTPAVLGSDERFRKGRRQLENRNLRQAIDTLGTVDHYELEDRATIEPLVRLSMADATFYQATDLAWIDARTLYLNFVTLYGSHPLAPYAQFQAGMCLLKQVSHPSKDQSLTHQAIGDFQEVITRFPGTPYAGAAKAMLREAEANLAEHDMIVGRFYLKRKRYVAATERFRRVLKHYPDHLDRESVYFYLGRALVFSNNSAEGLIYLDKLVTDYPDGKYSKEARKIIVAHADQTQDVARLDASP